MGFAEDFGLTLATHAVEEDALKKRGMLPTFTISMSMASLNCP